jgi:16S rRNA (uracil1498-N3)-methyltransferase
MSATPRLFVEADLAPQVKISLTTQQAHYVLHVLRLGLGGKVRVFNGAHGEYDACLQSVGKTIVQLEVMEQTRAQAAGPDVWLMFAPLKKASTDFLVEKSVEMGVSELLPVLTERAEAKEVRTDRLKRIAIEAAEQTERLDVPPVRDAMKLARAFADWDETRLVYYADESGDEGDRPWGGKAGRAPPMADVVRRQAEAKAAILIGPEGGFSPMERTWLRSLPYIRPIGLGPRILRAETAAVAALAIYQALAGDWRNP